MRESESSSAEKAMNTWSLHLQKLGLELKCLFCLEYLSQPVLLPCDHAFCFSCITKSAKNNSRCPLCITPYVDRELKPSRFLESIVTIYRNLEASYHAESGRVLEGCPDSVNNDFNNQLIKEPVRIVPENTSSSSSGRTVEVDTHNFSRDDEGEGFEFSQTNNRTPSLSLQLRSSRTEGCGCIKETLNQPVQSSPGNPLFGENRISVNGSNGNSRKYSLEGNSAKRQVEQGSAVSIRQERNETSTSGSGDSYVQPSKRQKKSNNRSPKTGFKNNEHFPSVVPYPKSLGIPSNQVEQRSAARGSELPVMSAHQNGSQFCAFCHSSSISEATGPMMHYANGKPVKEDKASNSSVIHAHTKCIEWAPQAYFVGETIKNLKKEVARGDKLKCSKCGRKGAVLGCYITSCKRSYHFPCALEIPGCRWDTEDYLLLCPSHFSSLFPREKSKPESIIPGGQPLDTTITSRPSSFRKHAPVKTYERVLCGSALSTEEKVLLVEFAGMAGLTVSKYWKPNVTHVIADTDADGACTRTFKVLMAILKGCWVLKIDWVKACMEAKQPVGEEPYEVCLDNHGCRDGPKTGRLRALDDAPKLFSGLNFYFVGDFLPIIRNNLQELIAAAGGHVLESEESLVAGVSDDFKPILIYYLELPEGCDPGADVKTLYERLIEAQCLAARVGGKVVGHTWLSESIAACKLLPYVH